MVFVLYLCFAALLTTVLTPAFMRTGYSLGIVDVPNARKIHTGTIPRTGGIALAIGTLVPFLLITKVEMPVPGILGGALCILAVGVIDDLFDLDYRLKFLGQIVAVVITLWSSGIRFPLIQELWPDSGWDLRIPTFILSAFFLLAAINAMNLADGLDGLAAGIGLLVFTSTGFLAYMQNDFTTLALCVCIIGASVGFLRFNTHPAVVFMGDGGSQFLGFMIGIATMLLTQSRTPYSPVLALYLIGIPVLDTAVVVFERMIEHRHVFKPDMNHLHHKLLRIGFKHSNSVVIIYATQLGLILLGWTMRHLPGAVLLMVYVGLMAALLTVLLFAKLKHLSLPYIHGASVSNGTDSRRGLRHFRTIVSSTSWFTLVGAFMTLYLLAPLWGRPVAKDVGLYSLGLSVLIVGFRFFNPGVSRVLLRVSAYFAAAYYILLFNLPRNAAAMDEAGAHILIFAIMGISYCSYMITTHEEIPVVTMDYLLLAVVVLTFFLPSTLLLRYHVHTITTEILVAFLGFELLNYKFSSKMDLLLIGLLLSLCLNFVMAFWPWVV